MTKERRGTNAQLVELMNKTYDRVKSKYPEVELATVTPAQSLVLSAENSQKFLQIMYL